MTDGALRFTTLASSSGVAEDHDFGHDVHSRINHESWLVAATVGSREFDYALRWTHVMR
jgi:hypothetical protein